MNTPKLSIIIVTTGTRDVTCQCLESIYRNAPKCAFEVIVVDNASIDGTCEAIASTYPHVHLIRSSHNLGFCGANNLGFEIARGEHYLLLNNDTIVLPESIDTLVAALEQDPTLGIVAPKLIYPDGSLQMSYGPMPTLFVSFCSFFDVKRLVPRTLMRKVARSPLGRLIGKNVGSYVGWSSGTAPVTARLESCLMVTGACMLIRGACFNDVGALDPNFFMYVDDADYCRRVHDAGWGIKYLAEAVIIHIKGGTVGQRYRWTAAPAYHSVFYFLEKHQGLAAARAGKAIALCSLGFRLAANALLRRPGLHAEWKLLRHVARWRVRSPRIPIPRYHLEQTVVT